MKTKIKTIHEEGNENSETQTSIGILYNYDIDNNNQYDVLFFRYKKNTYIFFKTLTNLIDYSLYGINNDIERSYLSEEKFDQYYDSDYIDGFFKNNLIWVL